MQKQQTGCFSIYLPFTSAAFNDPDSAQCPRFQRRYLPICHGMAAPNMVHIIPKNIVWQCFEYKKSIKVRNKPGERRGRSQTASIESLLWENPTFIFGCEITKSWRICLNDDERSICSQTSEKDRSKQSSPGKLCLLSMGSLFLDSHGMT